MAEALSTTEFLDRVEAEWIDDIRTSSIAAEVIAGPAFDAAQVSNALIGLARIARKYSDPFELANWPSAVVVAMSYKALEDYQQGAFWERFSESFTERRSAPWSGDDQKLWGEAYLISVKRLGLPTFETTRKYVGNIVMHAGVPTYCYQDFLRVLTRGISQIGYDGPAVVTWLRARMGTSTFVDIDTPVRDFIETGDIFAADFIARNIELLDRLRHGEEVDGVGLSSRYVELAEDFVQDGGVRQLPQPRTQNQLRPTLHLDTGADRLILTLPPVRDGQGMRWSVSADGEVYDVKPPTAWSSTHGADSVPWDVPTPAQRLTVASTIDPTLTFDLTLISPRAPYLLFNEVGAHISADSPVPAEAVWILRLDDGTSVRTQGEVRTIARASFPLGWSDWQLELIDLSNASTFTVGDSPPRRVNIKTRAQFVCGPVVPWVTSNGLQVLADRPIITLPLDVSSSAWSVSVKDLRNGAFLPAPTDLTRPLGDLDENLVGTFEIAVRGPLGRGARRRVCIVEQFAASAIPAFRALSAQGIDPCQIKIEHPASMTVSDEAPHLDAATASTSVSVTSASGTVDLLVSPPCMSVSIETPGELARWDHSPVSLRTDTFANSRLLIRLPPYAKGVVGLRVSSASVHHQTIDSARVGDVTTAIYPLDKAADTVGKLGVGQLTLQIPGREIVVGSFRPARLASSARLVGNRVVVDGLATTEVEAITWALYAPWLGPTICVISGGAFAIPSPLSGHGPVVFNLRVVDPWVSEPAPSSPAGRDLFSTDAPTDDRADVLTKYLTGFDTSRRGDFDATHVMEQLSFSSPHAAPHLCRLAPWQVDELRRTSSPDDRLAALSALEVSRPRRPHLAVLAGIATEAFTPIYPSIDSQLADHLAFHPLEGSLRDLDLLADEDSPQRFPEMWRQAGEQLGTDVLHVLCGSPDPSRSKPTFDANAAMLLEAPQAIRDQIISASKYLPRAISDVDSRTVAAWQLFASLENPRLSAVTTDSLTILSEATHLLRGQGLDREADAIRAREDPAAERRWMALPAVSLALALAGRLGARGHRDLYLFAKARESHWAVLSSIARKLTEIDLVLAEAYAASSSRAVHPSPSDILQATSSLEELT